MCYAMKYYIPGKLYLIETKYGDTLDEKVFYYFDDVYGGESMIIPCDELAIAMFIEESKLHKYCSDVLYKGKKITIVTGHLIDTQK